jgi:hypothetical protein
MPDMSDKHAVVFHGNVVNGNMIVDTTKANSDLSITHCSFIDVDAGIPVELWFAYVNCSKIRNALDEKSVEIMCRENSVCALDFNLNGNDLIEVVQKCLALLKRNVTNSLPNI